MQKKLGIILSILIIILLLLVFVISKIQISQTQKVRTKAAGNGKIAIYFLSDKTTLNPGGVAAVSVWFKNTTASETLQLNVGEVDVNFNQNIFTASFVGPNPCNQSFLYNAQKKTVSAGDVYIVCSLGGGDPLISLAPGATIKLADFNLTAASGAAGGATQLSFAKTNIPNAGDPVNLTDLSDGGTNMNLTITGGNPTATVTPPAGATATPTKMPTVTPTPTTPVVSSPTPSPTAIPNTFNKTILFNAKGVLVSTDQSVNDYRNGAGKISMKITIYNRDNISLTTGEKTYVATYISTGNLAGVYRVSLLNVPNDFLTNAIMLVKADKHLRIKFCHIGQSQRCDRTMESTQGINFSSGDDLSFIQYALLPGDVNQDGVLNGVDVDLMIKEFAKDPPSRNVKYDLNYDGVVNGADYALMLGSMSVYDDE